MHDLAQENATQPIIGRVRKSALLTLTQDNWTV